jgi:hypothetical protein
MPPPRNETQLLTAIEQRLRNLLLLQIGTLLQEKIVLRLRTGKLTPLEIALLWMPQLLERQLCTVRLVMSK